MSLRAFDGAAVFHGDAIQFLRPAVVLVLPAVAVALSIYGFALQLSGFSRIFLLSLCLAIVSIMTTSLFLVARRAEVSRLELRLSAPILRWNIKLDTVSAGSLSSIWFLDTLEILDHAGNKRRFWLLPGLLPQGLVKSLFGSNERARGMSQPSDM